MTNRLAAVLLAAVSLTTAPITWAQSEEPITISIDESQPLSDALQSFADQTDLQVIFFADITEGKTSPGVDGEYPVDAALDTILADTGLSYTFIDDTAVSVQAVASDQGGDSEQKNSEKAPVLMAQNVSSTTGTETSNRSDDGGTSIVTGKVTDARTGANLKGALVKIEESGQTTSTNDLGEFRFVNVPTGQATLTVSYLGYAGQTTGIAVHGESTSQDFALRGRSEMEEIVVFGQRSARAIALNKQRTSENNADIVTADLLGNFTATTVSDALRRLPGVSFQQNAIGEGTNIIIRGLEPDLSLVKLNGLVLPVGNGRGRSAGLNNLLADSVESITIHKTLLPRHHSSGTGGLVEIETKSPLDRPRRFGSLSFEAGQRSDDFSDDAMVSGILSGTFGSASNIGISASIQYRERENSNVSYGASLDFGEYLPLQPGGSPVSSRLQVDPRAEFPFETGASGVYASAVSDNLNSFESNTLAATLSGEIAVGQHSNLRLDLQRSEGKFTRFARTVGMTTVSAYVPLPIAELNGEVRQALAWEGVFGPGTGFAFVDQVYGLDKDQTDTTDTLSFRGESKVRNWSFDYQLGYARGRSTRPSVSSINILGSFTDFLSDPSWVLPLAIDSVEQRALSIFPRRSPNDREFILPLLSDEGWSFVNQPSNSFLAGGGLENRRGENERYTSAISANFDFDNGPLDYLEAGVFWEESEFSSNVDTIFISGFTGFDTLGIPLQEPDLGVFGVAVPGFARASERDIGQFINTIETFAATNDAISLVPIEPDPRAAQQRTQEDNLAGYIQAAVDVGRLEAIFGARIDRVKVRAIQLTSPRLIDQNGVEDLVFADRFKQLLDEDASSVEILPRALFNFRANDRLVFRGAYYRSVARPRISQLSSTQSVRLDLRPLFGPESDRPLLSVFKGNPALSPAFTDTFELGIEYYSGSIGLVKVGVFYKDIDNLLQDNESVGSENLEGVELPDDPNFANLPDNVFVSVTRPDNNKKSARIWGFDSSVEYQFTSLPRFWNGLGVYANYAYSESSKTETVNWLGPAFETVTTDISSVPFDESPEHSGTFALTYNKYGIDSTLAYTFQDRRQVSFAAHGLSSYAESVDTLDFRLAYHFPIGSGEALVYIEGADLLRGVTDTSLEVTQGGSNGVPRYYSGATYLGGREFRIGMSAKF